ncbi:MAG: radical SAM protein [Candidatus Thermoplasmatota archaeon]
MKILLVFPKVKNRHPDITKEKNIFVKLFGETISLTLPQVAAATPCEHTVRIVDENYEKINFNEDIDLVGITCLTMAAPRAYEIADQFRRRGITVVLGGNHPSALPQEAKQHADSVVIGEAEKVWPQLLKDVERGKLQPFYKSTEKISPEDIPEPRRDLINRRFFSDGLLIKRGCPNQCEFCTVTSLYSHDIRSIDSVLKEISHMPAKIIFIYDQNLTSYMTYTMKLLKELKSVHKRWQANATIDILGKEDGFLQAAKEAGIFYWYIGFESISQQSLDQAKKGRNRVDEYPATIKKIKQHGMIIVGSFIFGFDQDTPDIFDATLQKLDEWDIDMAEFHILTPFPGTALYTRLKSEDRILSENWELYNTANVVFQPKNMTKQELFERTRTIAREYYRYRRILKRSFRALEQSRSLFVPSIVFFQNLKYRMRFKYQFNF